MKRLVIGTDTFLPRNDGISRFLTDVLPGLSKHFDIVVIAPDYGPASCPCTLIQLPTSKREIGGYVIPKSHEKTIIHHVAKADIVFTQTIGPIGSAIINRASVEGTTIASYIHSKEWELFSKYFDIPRIARGILERATLTRMRSLYGKASLLLVPSHEDALFLQSHRIRTPARVVTLGVDIQKFIPEHNKIAAKQMIGIDPSEIVIGYVGRISHEKDLPTLVRAHQWVRRTHKSKLLIVGSGNKKLEKTLSEKNGVIHINATPHITPYLNAMDIFVMPSHTETSSLATLEAMSCAIPVITTRVGMMKDYVRDSENGYTFNRSDWMRLAKHITKLCDDVALRKRMGERARQNVTADYRIEQTVENLIHTLDTIS